MVFIVIASWFGAGAVAAVFSYGMTRAYFNGEYAGVDNSSVAWVMALFTFLAAPVVVQVFLLSRFAKHGLLFA